VVHDTPSRIAARKLIQDASRLTKEAKILRDVRGMEAEAVARELQAAKLREEVQKLLERARLEDVSIRQVDYWKDTKKGSQNYPRWVCSWQEGDKIVTKYLGSCKKIGRAEALDRAKRVKAEALK
jgi:hypothetical protein